MKCENCECALICTDPARFGGGCDIDGADDFGCDIDGADDFGCDIDENENGEENG